MTTKTNSPVVRSIYQVNPEPADVVSGAALLTYIVSVAARREHLRDSVLSIQFDRVRGIGILVKDAGSREHLANALGMPRDAGSYKENRTNVGTGMARVGTIECVEVWIWNLEP